MRLNTMMEQAIRYGLVGVVNTGIDIALFLLLVKLFGVAPVPANVVSFSCGAVNSFVLNRHWTFGGGQKSHSDWRAQAMAFAVVTLLGLGLSSLVVWLLHPVIGPTLAKLAATIVTFASTFIINKLLVFKA